MKRILIILFSIIVILLSFGCGSILGPAAPGKPLVAAGGESLTITWNAVKEAVEYTLYYTLDYSDPIMPNPRMKLDVVFPGYLYEEDVALVLVVPYDPIQDTVVGSTTIQNKLTGITDNIGYVSFDCDIDHKRFWGFTIFKDIDANGTMTTGDVVWGSGGSGVFGYKFFPYYLADSVYQLYENWGIAGSHKL